MSELKCPFCQQELHKDSDGYYTCYTDNCGCWANGGNGASGSESLWLTLIRTRKALDAALDKLKRIQKIYTNAPFNAPINYANVCTDMYDVATEQIKELDNE